MVSFISTHLSDSDSSEKDTLCHQCRLCSSQPSSLLNAEEQRMIREATLGFYFSKMPNYSRKTTSIFFFVKQLFMTFAMFCIELFMSFFSVSCHFSTKAIPKLQLFTVAMNFLSVLLICNSVFLSFCLFAHILLCILLIAISKSSQTFIKYKNLVLEDG